MLFTVKKIILTPQPIIIFWDFQASTPEEATQKLKEADELNLQFFSPPELSKEKN